MYSLTILKQYISQVSPGYVVWPLGKKNNLKFRHLLAIRIKLAEKRADKSTLFFHCGVTEKKKSPLNTETITHFSYLTALMTSLSPTVLEEEKKGNIERKKEKR